MSGIYTLLKVAKEINVGKDTIVEFLKDNKKKFKF